MNYKFLLSISLLFILIFLSESPNKELPYPEHDFISPMKKQIFLSGTFGELRPNHFHAGIDIKGKTGESIYAIANGYIARIKVQSGSYGRVLYIKHPNGYTSVYAHMKKFSKEVEAAIKRKQYAEKSFAVQIFPTKNDFLVNQGEKIGEIGMTGNTFGPHLHFEIRNSNTEIPINPLLFKSIKVKDKTRPIINQIKIYELNHQKETGHASTYNTLKRSTGQFRIKQDTILVGADQIGIGVKTYDIMDGVSNYNGVYSLDMLVDDRPGFGFKMEAIPFSKTRYINAHTDYEERLYDKSYFNRCYQLPGNKLDIYPTKVGQIIKVGSIAKKIKVIVKDIEGNTSRLVFWVKKGKEKPFFREGYNYFCPYNEESYIDNGNFTAYFPKGALYENLYLEYSVTSDESGDVYSLVHHFHTPRIALHKYVKIGIAPSEPIDAPKSKFFIAYCDKDSQEANVGGKWENEKLVSKVRSLGDYYIRVDTIKPTITPQIFSNNMRGKPKMRFAIKDNFPSSGKAKELKFKGYIDGNWALFDYDAKNDRITHYFEADLSRGNHTLKIELTDAVGNERVLERKFTR